MNEKTFSQATLHLMTASRISPLGGGPEGPWTELRTYIFSGAQFWKLVSGQPVNDPEQAGLFEAKKMMAQNKT